MFKRPTNYIANNIIASFSCAISVNYLASNIFNSITTDT